MTHIYSIHTLYTCSHTHRKATLSTKAHYVNLVNIRFSGQCSQEFHAVMHNPTLDCLSKNQVRNSTQHIKMPTLL